MLFIMRHGETLWNKKGIHQGRSKNRLSALGKEQVNAAAKRFKKGDIDEIFSSPMMRTMQTANIMNKILKVKIVRDERLAEIDKGVLTGRKISSLTEEERKLQKENPHALKMEAVEDVLKRVESFFQQLKTMKDKNILIVTHGIVAFMLEKLVLNKKHEALSYYETTSNKYSNAEIRKFTID